MLTNCPHAGGKMIAELMKVTKQPFDYQYLCGLLKDFKHPRNKISSLISSGELIALKRGLYILSEQYNQRVLPEVIANALYGPSYISSDYALAYYGMIPERAYNISSVTTGRKKLYHTKVGTYSYRSLKLSYYQIAYHIQTKEGTNFLIATPEKALCDKLYYYPVQPGIAELDQALSEDLRIDHIALQSLKGSLIMKIAKTANSTNLNLLSKMVKQ